MGAFTKYTEEVQEWFYQIGRQMGFPYMNCSTKAPQDIRDEIFLHVLPLVIPEDFQDVMRNYIQNKDTEEADEFGCVRFRSDDVGDFTTYTQEGHLDWLMRNYSISSTPADSYFVLHRTIKKIDVTEEDNRVSFEITTDKDNYPYRVSFSKKQMFVWKLFLSANNLDADALLSGPVIDIQKALQKTKPSFYILKYLKDYNYVSGKGVFGTYSMISPTYWNLVESFRASVAGGFVSSFQPTSFPRPFFKKLNTRKSKKVTSKKVRTNKYGHLYLHRFENKGCFMIKRQMVAFLEDDKFEWLQAKPQLELLPFMEQLL